MKTLVNIFFGIRSIISQKHFNLMVLLFLFMVISVFLEILSLGSIPLFIGFITNFDEYSLYLSRYVDIKNYSFSFIVYSLTGLLVFLFFLKNIFLLFIIYFENNLVAKLKSDISQRLFSYYLNKPYDFFVGKNPSEITRNLVDEVTKCCQAILLFLVFMREFIVLIGIGILAVTLKPLISISISMYILLSALIYIFIFRLKLTNWGKELMSQRKNLFKNVSETISSIKEIKLLNNSSFFTSIFKNSVNKIENISLKSQVIFKSTRSYFEIISISALFLIIYLSDLSENNIENSLQIFAFVGVILVRFIPMFNILTQNFTNMKFLNPSFNLIKSEMFNLQKDKKKLLKQIFIKKFNSLEFKNISYVINGKPIINNFSFKIDKNDKIGIVGTTGSGKTTLINLMLGLIKPNSGEIFINKKKIDYEKESYFFGNLGFLSQEAFIIDDSIKNNVFLDTKPTKKIVKNFERLLRKFRLDNMIMGRKLSLDSNVGSSGIKISGGEKQRILLIRMLITNPNLIFIDEGTSALDKDTELKVTDEIFSKNYQKTIIFISHKISSLKKCNKIFNLANNKLNITNKV